MKKIKVIIADDNKEVNEIIKVNLEKYEEIEILGTCISDEEEISMIENLHPEIVITDLIRSGKLTGLEVIRNYKKRGSIPKFLVVTACDRELIDVEIMDGFINKPFINYNVLVNQLRLITANSKK